MGTCVDSQRGDYVFFAATSVLLSTLLAPQAHAAPAAKADICHWSDSSAQVLSVSANAVAAHFANHGDSYAGFYFTDGDGDDYGDAAAATDRCPNDGFVADNTDCDDDDADVNPGAEEVAYDGVDNDCSAGSPDDDLDGDGYVLADDCDDGDADVNPGAEDTCGDGSDNDCDGTADQDCATGCPCAENLQIYDPSGSGAVSSDDDVSDLIAAVDVYDYSNGSCLPNGFSYAGYYTDYRWYQVSSRPEADGEVGAYAFFATALLHEPYTGGTAEGSRRCLFYAYDDVAGWSASGGSGWTPLTDAEYAVCNEFLAELIDTEECYYTYP